MVTQIQTCISFTYMDHGLSQTTSILPQCQKTHLICRYFDTLNNVLVFWGLFLIFQNKNVSLYLDIEVFIKTSKFGLRSAYFFSPGIRFSYPIQGSSVWFRYLCTLFCFLFLFVFVCLFIFFNSYCFWHPKRDTRISRPTSKKDPFYILVFAYAHDIQA